jgi:hypothetical protein
LLIVSEETSLGMPALICAWREGICPWPACSTWPITTCSTCSGSTPARSSAALIATRRARSHRARRGRRPSCRRGCARWPRITVLGIETALSCEWSGKGRRPPMVVDRPAIPPRPAGAGAARPVRRRGARTLLREQAGRISCRGACRYRSAPHQPARREHRRRHGRVGVFEGEEPPPQAPAELASCSPRARPGARSRRSR